MADELTPQEQRELDAIDRALSGRGVDPELEDIAALTNELRDARATPTPEYAEELDRRAAAWVADTAPRRRNVPWLKVAIPAALTTAAGIAIAVVIAGGGTEDPTLELSAVEQEPRSGALAAPESTQDSSGGGAELDGAAPVFAIDGLQVNYTVFTTTEARIKLGDVEETIELAPGAGTIEISTEDFDPGEYALEVTMGAETQTATVAVE